MKLVNLLVSGLLYRIWITKMFPTKAIEMIAVYKMAKVSLILDGYENGGCTVEPEGNEVPWLKQNRGNRSATRAYTERRHR